MPTRPLWSGTFRISHSIVSWKSFDSSTPPGTFGRNVMCSPSDRYRPRRSCSTKMYPSSKNSVYQRSRGDISASPGLA